ncbi:DUF3558 domain-containing protein [Streptomyces sp. H27-D2]|uniref:DUF3558 domain-containing protein n=1 Tax=Streptomyces sp. H27-D2 TaxID=3046304 RepID=UPI002DBE4EF5|nr:DUF3558 domain-containing protein [Streptomyces sp. H27-D2]MEC4016993.1 DUF3558 domain-containing protein [Streptomyces sp. H27-D2]
MHRTATRLARILACAAVPVMLVAGCSSDSDKKDSSESSKSPASSAPALKPAKFNKLPDACAALAEKTVKDLVPKVKDAKGDAAKSSDTSARGGCSWNGLDGFQYRWLDVSLQRFDSDPALGTGDTRAKDYYGKQIAAAKASKDAKNIKDSNADGTGDEATAVTYDLKKDGEEYKNQTVVTRTANIVVTLNYNGAGFEDAKAPDSGDMMKDTQKAAKEAVASVADANKKKSDADKKK